MVPSCGWSDQHHVSQVLHLHAAGAGHEGSMRQRAQPGWEPARFGWLPGLIFCVVDL